MGTPATLNINLTNNSGQSPVYAFITGTALSNNQVVLLQSDGQTLYFPANPSAVQTPLAADVAIDLGAPGNTVTVTIPKIAGGRIWFSYGTPLTFLLNPGGNGPALVEPSVSNPTDPNINSFWGFAEFTYNDAQFFGNISYVDFFSVPISLSLQNSAGAVQHVSGTGPDGLTTVANGLQAQQAADGVNWSSLIVNQGNGQPLRVLSPNLGLVGNPGLFDGYWEPYINQIWSQFTDTDLQIDTQASYGTVAGRVNDGTLTFPPDGVTFIQPSARDIFTCSTGPFAANSPEALAIIPRLAAGFNRTVLQLNVVQPDGTNPSQYYQTSPTNHYSRILHSTNLDGRGYAFPYDDVTPTGGQDQAGTVFDGSPTLVSLAVGGNGAYAA